MALYMVQYLAQLNGLYEMRFWFFIMPMFLIFYQDWKVYVPFAAIIVIHHTFIYVSVLQGNNDYLRYFINMDTLTNMTFFYHMGLAVLGVLTAALVSHRLALEATNRFRSSLEFKTQYEEMTNLAFNVKDIADSISNKDSVEEHDVSVDMVLKNLGSELENVVGNIIVETNQVM